MEHLPPEILGQIFMDYVAGLREGWSVFNTAAGPGLLAAVCTTWRSVALAYPNIWCHNMVINTRTGMGYRDGLTRLRTLLERCEAHLLCFTINHWFWDISNQYHSFLVKVIELLVERSSQWEEVHIINVPYKTIPTLFSAQGHYPQLRSVEVFLHPDAIPSDPTHNYGFIGGPRLNDVKIYNIPIHGVNLPFSQLRSLVHHGRYFPATSVGRALAILDKCPQLELFDFDSGRPDVHRPPPAERIEYGLKSLLTGDISLLRALKLAELESLSVMPSQRFNALPDIRDFIQASRCCLSTLRVDDCLLEIEGLAAILDLNPSLVEWSIHISIRHRTAMGALIDLSMQEVTNMLTLVTEGAGGIRIPTFLPHLKVMEYFDHVNTDVPIGFIDSAFVDMLRVRYRSDGEGLKRVDVVTECGALGKLDRDGRERLRKLRADGMIVRIVNSYEYSKMVGSTL